MTPSPNAISSSITTYFSNHQLAEPIQHMRQPYFATSNLIRAMWHPGRTGSKRNPSQRMTLTRWRGAPTATGCWAGRMAYVHVRHVFSHECRVMCCHVILNRNMRPRNESSLQYGQAEKPAGKRYMRQVGLQEAAFPLP